MKTPPYQALVVDDEVVARRMLAMALEQEGFVCDTACDGLHAIELMDERKYDLVVTDLRMPNKHGHALAVDILVDRERPVLIIHTSMDDPRLTKDLMVRGVDDILYKPTNYATFATRAMFYVEKRRASLVLNASIKRNSNADDDQLPTLSSSQLIESNPKSSPAALGAIHAEPLPLPVAARKVYQLVVQDTIDTGSLALAIEQDSSLAADLFCFGNCLQQSRSGKKISDLTQIVSLVGHNRIGEIALAACVRTATINQQLPWINVDLAHQCCILSGIVLDSLVRRGQHQLISQGLLLCALTYPLESFVEAAIVLKKRGQVSCAGDQNDVTLEPISKKSVFQQGSPAWDEIFDSRENPSEVAAITTGVINNYSTIEMLPEPTRSRIELVKLANYFSQVAVNSRTVCDKIEMPNKSLLERLRLGVINDILFATNKSLSEIAQYKSI
jgi:DNA-binding response OmpR family regulator